MCQVMLFGKELSMIRKMNRNRRICPSRLQILFLSRNYHFESMMYNKFKGNQQT